MQVFVYIYKYSPHIQIKMKSAKWMKHQRSFNVFETVILKLCNFIQAVFYLYIVLYNSTSSIPVGLL